MQGDPPSTTTPLLSENSSQIQEKSLSEPLPAGPPEKYYKRRWWILLVFSLLYAQQCNQWITFGPIEPAAEELYGPIDVNLLAAWGPIIFIPCIFLSSWLLDTVGLRITTIIGTALVAAGGTVRAITTTTPAAIYLMHLGQILNAAAGPIVMGAPPLISAVWFPLNQRTLSTAVVTESVNLGTLAGFATSLLVTDGSKVLPMLRGEAAVSIVLFIASVIYFPSKPPAPANNAGETAPLLINNTNVVPVEKKSDAKKKLARFWKDTFHIMKIPPFLLVAAAYGITSGVISGWQALLEPLLSPLGYSQNEVGAMGSAAAIGAMLVSPIAGRISDWCNRKMKPVYLLLYGVFTVAMTFFCLMTTDIIPNWRPGVYISCIITIAAINTVTPVLYELAVDITFPVLESTSCGVLVLGNNVFCLIFLLGGENANPEVLNWVVVGTGVVVFVAMLFLKKQYPRKLPEELKKEQEKEQEKEQVTVSIN